MWLWRVARTLAPVLLTAALGAWVAWEYWESLLDWWITPLLSATPTGDSGTLASVVAALDSDLRLPIRVRQTALTALCTATPTALAQLWRLTARQLGVRSRLAGVVYVGLACTLFIASIYLGAVRFLPEFRVNLYMGRLQVLPTAYAVVLDGLEIFPSLVLAQNLLVQPPLLVLYLSTVATLQREHYHTMLKWLVVLAFVGAALVTPPGPMSQLLIALPLSVAYIASCLLGYRLLVLRKRCSG